jgi:signal transduction histidine kinase
LPCSRFPSLASSVKRRIALTILVIAVITNPLVEGDFEALPEDVLTFGAAWVLGALARTRRAYIAVLERRAEQLERERRDQARLARAEERARIATELHDVVAHGMSVMVVQTQAARSVLMRDPAKADEALERVENVGRHNLDDIRRLLESPAPRRRRGAPIAPARDEATEGAGRLLRYRRPRDPASSRRATPRVPSSIDLSAYRVLQESLINVLKHSGTKRADVVFSRDDRCLRIGVSNAGSAPTPPATASRGHGIVGMRERVSLVAGTLEAVPRPEGGFRVVTEFPMGDGT